MRRTALALTPVVLLLAAAPARADTAVASVTHPTPVVAAGTTYGWLTGRGEERVLAYRVGERPMVTTAVRAGEDVTAGLDRRGRPTFVWSDCRARRCAIRALRPGQTRARTLTRVRRAGQPPVPALAGGRLVTARVFRTAGGRPCSAPFVRRLGSRLPARVLRPGVCGIVQDVHVDGDRVLVRLDDSFVISGNATEQLRLVSLRGTGRGRLIASENAGERPNTIGGFARRGRTVTYALPGGQDNPSRIRRLDLRTGREREVPAHETLWGGLGSRYVVSPLGGYAPIGSGAAYLRMTIDIETSNAHCTPTIPCTIVRGGDPFRTRLLARRVRLDDTRRQTTTITGHVERARVRGRRTLGRVGVAGVPVELLAAGDVHEDGDPDSATPTGLTGVTDAEGRFAIRVPEPHYPVDFVARTADTGVPAVGYLPLG